MSKSHLTELKVDTSIPRPIKFHHFYIVSTHAQARENLRCLHTQTMDVDEDSDLFLTGLSNFVNYLGDSAIPFGKHENSKYFSLPMNLRNLLCCLDKGTE